MVDLEVDGIVYSLGHEIGRGSFGRVYTVLNYPDLVVKVIQNQSSETTQLEITLMTLLNGDYFPEFVGAGTSNSANLFFSNPVSDRFDFIIQE
jgi:hypothetical protein